MMMRVAENRGETLPVGGATVAATASVIAVEGHLHAIDR